MQKIFFRLNVEKIKFLSELHKKKLFSQAEL